jgi:hypothetical protein
VSEVFPYAIDREDRIVSVGESWLAFAEENRASELTRERVLGRSLWSFVAGSETRLLYREVFRRVRTRAESAELPFRCDSPECFRFMRLRLDPGPRDSIRCRGITVREQARPFFSILDRAFPRSDSTLDMCSFCKKIGAFGSEWLEAEDAIRRLNLFESARLPRLEHVVCPSCASVCRAEPDGATAG